MTSHAVSEGLVDAEGLSHRVVEVDGPGDRYATDHATAASMRATGSC